MKIIFLILAFSAIAFCASAQVLGNPVRSRSRDSHYDANLKFDWTGENSLRGKIEAIFKPIVPALSALGFKGDLLRDHNGKNNGHISGNFHFNRDVNGKRGRDGKSNGKSGGTDDTPLENSNGNSNTAESYPNAAQHLPASSKNGRIHFPKNLPSPAVDFNAESQLDGLQNLPSLRMGRNSLPFAG